MKTKKLVICALLAALTCIATFVTKFPISFSGEGYINLGDCIVLMSGFLLGPLYGAIAGGVGSMLADCVLGYYVYAPATLVIKGLMALVAAFILKAFKEKKTIGSIVGALAGELIMISGYVIFEIFLYGPAGAFAGIPGNATQALFGFVVAVILYKLLGKNRYINNILKK